MVKAQRIDYGHYCIECTFRVYTHPKDSMTKTPALCMRYSCPIEDTLSVIGGVWKVIIIRELLDGTRRYSQLHRKLDGVTHKMLTQQLRELETDGVVHREVYRVVPPKVEYSLTPLGRKLSPLLDTMREWGVSLVEERDRNAISESTAASA